MVKVCTGGHQGRLSQESSRKTSRMGGGSISHHMEKNTRYIVAWRLQKKQLFKNNFFLQGNYQRDMREGEGVLSYPGGHQDVGSWKGTRLIRLKFAITEISITPAPYHQRPNNGRLMTPDVHSRGKCGPKGYLEVREALS